MVMTEQLTNLLHSWASTTATFLCCWPSMWILSGICKDSEVINGSLIHLPLCRESSSPRLITSLLGLSSLLQVWNCHFGMLFPRKWLWSQNLCSLHSYQNSLGICFRVLKITVKYADTREGFTGCNNRWHPRFSTESMSSKNKRQLSIAWSSGRPRTGFQVFPHLGSSYGVGF